MKGAKNFAYDRNALVELGVIWGDDAVRAFRCHPGAIVCDVQFTYGHPTKPKLFRTRCGSRGGSRKCRQIAPILARRPTGRPVRIRCQPNRQSLIEIQLRGCSSTPQSTGSVDHGPGHENPPADSKHFLPSLYVLKINSLAKPHAKGQLLADLQYYRIGISIISE